MRAVHISIALVLVLAGPAMQAYGKPVPCSGGRYLLTDKPLVAGVDVPAIDAVVLSGKQLSTASGCGAVVAKVKATKKGTVVRARFDSCRNVTGRAVLSARISPDCTTMTGLFTAKKSHVVKERFTATVSTCGDGIVDAAAGEECDGSSVACVNGCQVCRCVASGSSTSTTSLAPASTTSTTTVATSSSSSTSGPQPTTTTSASTSTSAPASTNSTAATTTSTTSTSFTPPTLDPVLGIVVSPGEVAIEPNGKCSLKEAIVNANKDAAVNADCPAGSGVDTITLPAGLYDMTAPGDGAIRTSMNIKGAGAATTILDGKAIVRVLKWAVDDSASPATAFLPVVTVSDVTIQNGRADDVSPSGGGIDAFGYLTLERVILTGNRARDGDPADSIYSCTEICKTTGGSGGDGGAVNMRGTLSINASIVYANHVGNGGAAGYVSPTACPPKPSVCDPANPASGCLCAAYSDPGSPGQGGGILVEGWPQYLNIPFPPGSLTITNSLVAGNTGAGLVVRDASSLLGGPQQPPSATAVAGSVFAGNAGGGIFLSSDGPKSIVNSTISSNDVGLHTEAKAPTLSFVTVANNGVGLDAVGGLYLKNSVVADNGTDLQGTFTSQGYNHVENVGGAAFAPGLDVTGVDAGLLPLGDNGGSTWTHALAPGSPAINAIPAGVQDCGVAVTKDQRGYGPRPTNGFCDKGAFEVGAQPPPGP